MKKEEKNRVQCNICGIFLKTTPGLSKSCVNNDTKIVPGPDLFFTVESVHIPTKILDS